MENIKILTKQKIKYREAKVTMIFDHLIWDIVYLKTDPEQLARMVTSIIIRPKDIIYELACGKEVSNHYNSEISTQKNLNYGSS